MIDRKNVDVSEERKILSHMIMSTPFLNQLKGIAESKFFKASYSQIVVKWIWEFFEFTGESPGKHIEDIYINNRHTIDSEEEYEMIGEFLSSLSKDYIENQLQNVKYAVKNAIDYFKIRSLEKLKDDLDLAIYSKNAKHGERLIADFRRVDRPIGQGVDLLKDSQAVSNAFKVENEILFSFPKVLGEVIGPFYRGDFVSFSGSYKKGKTWWLIYTAIRALLMGHRVVFFSLEMTEDPVIRRFWQSLSGKPLQPTKVKIPYFIESAIPGMCDIEYREEDKSELNIDHTKIKEKQKIYSMASGTGQLRIITYPSDTASIEDLKDAIRNLEYYENIVQDVIVVDYADILIPKNPRSEYRHQLDSIWKGLRSMAQEWFSLVVTASQVTGKRAIEYEASYGDIAEDKR